LNTLPIYQSTNGVLDDPFCGKILMSGNLTGNGLCFQQVFES
jgi:hypothetical protein